MNINERFIKISGRYPVEKEVELTQGVVIMVKGYCVKRDEKDRQDGSKDVISIIKPVDVQIVEENV